MNNATLWQQYKLNPQPDLKQQIIVTYTNLVHYVIHNSKFININIVDERDYFQFGVEGLSEAIDRFEPDYGTKFETYAIQRIRGKIIDQLRKLQIKPRLIPDPKKDQVKYHNVSLHQSFDNDEGYMLYEIIPSETEIAPDDYAVKNERKEFLVDAIKNLEERDRLIITLYYFENLNYKEIANVLDITVSRVSQIHSKIIKELRGTLTVDAD